MSNSSFLHLKDGRIGTSQSILFTTGLMSGNKLISELVSMAEDGDMCRKTTPLTQIRIIGSLVNTLSTMKLPCVRRTSLSMVRTSQATHTRNKRSIKRVIVALVIAMKILP
jgi:hypothetical protein